MPRPFLLSFAVTLALSLSAFAQLPPDQAPASLTPGEGLQVELFAAEPMLINPTSIDVDHLGRVWVAEAVNYRRKLFRRPMLREEGDRIVVLTDTNGDGKADKSQVFYQGKDLYGPLSVLVLPQVNSKALRVLVAQSPDILEFWDKDGDLVADGPPTKWLSGFGGFDHDHGVHGLTIGPDGRLYFTVGDAGVTGLQSRDGAGKKYVSNNTDVQKGTVWRCDLDGNNLELIAHNFRNNYEACVDSFGEIWCSDNDDDGNQQTRICFVMPGGNYGYGPRGAGQSHWHEEQPGIVHKTLRTGFGSPTGICFNEGSLLPKQYADALLHTDAGPRELRAFIRKPKGAGYELDKLNMVTSSDNWFRPSDVCMAPDGSVFIADWYDPGVGGHGMGDWTRGRIYRVTPKGHKGYKVPKVELGTKEGVVAALGSPCLGVRQLGFMTVNSKPIKEALEFIKTGLVMDQQGSLAARCKWLVSIFGPKSKPSDASREFLDVYGKFEKQTKNDASFNALGVRSGTGYVLMAWLPFYPESYCVTPEMAPAHREWLIKARNQEPSKVKGEIMTSAKLYDGKDIFYRAALNIACGTDPARRDAILADFDKHFPKWNDKVADLVWELQPKSVLPRLHKLLKDDSLTVKQKARIIDILAASPDPKAGGTMLTILNSNAAAEVKARAIDNLRLFLRTKWIDLTKSDELKQTAETLLGNPKTVTTGLQLVAVAGLTGSVKAVAAIAENETNELPLRFAAIQALGELHHVSAVDALINMGQPQSEISVEVVKALGRHLPTRPNEGGPAKAKSLEALQTAITLEKANIDIKRAALTELAGSRVGTDWLLELKQKKELPTVIDADAGRLLRNSPFQGQRNKALILFPTAAMAKLDLAKLPPLKELAKLKGNAEKGKVVLARTALDAVQCLKCHTIRGQGGHIGPDLSMIGKKGSRENIYESILQPSKAIADQYVSWKIDTVDGQSIVGLLVAESDKAVTLRDANGKDYVIPVGDIDQRTKSLVSLMPDNLAIGFTQAELIDVVEYLTTLQTASLTLDSWQIAGPFPAESMNAALKKEFFPENGERPNSNNKIGWKTIRAGVNGHFDLAAFHGEKGTNSASYLYREIESPRDQNATVLLGTDDGGRLWVNGKEVWKSEATRAAAPAQDRVDIALKKGVNRVMLKVANGNNPHGFYLTLTSEEELKAK